MYVHERKIADEIKKDRSRKMWENINYLREGTKKKESKELSIVNEIGEKLKEEDADKEVLRYWTDLYKSNDRKIDEEWEQIKMEPESSTETLEAYKDNVRIKITEGVVEHMDMALHIKNNKVKVLTTSIGDC